MASADLIPTSEVLGCSTAVSRWDPSRLVTQWLGSPVHRSILLHRPRTTHAACLVRERQGRVAALCTLWKPNGRPL